MTLTSLNWTTTTNFCTLASVTADQFKILVLHGPNLNLLGQREPGRYGHVTLEQINTRLAEQAVSLGVDIDCRQSNAEHDLVDWIQGASAEGFGLLVINPAAFTHTSVAVRDAVLAVGIPVIEVHLSNIYAREPFRAHSYLSDIATGVISGFGPVGYELALTAAAQQLREAG